MNLHFIDNDDNGAAWDEGMRTENETRPFENKLIPSKAVTIKEKGGSYSVPRSRGKGKLHHESTRI